MPVYLCDGCPTEVCNDPSLPCQTRQVGHVGMVLGTDEYNGAHDSDFYVLVWNPDKQCVQRAWYRSTAHWTYHNGAAVDATPEVVAAARDWYRRAWLDKAVADAEAAARRVEIDREVVSLTTRGANKGVRGVVEWIGPDRYRRDATRVRIRVAGQAAGRYLDADRVRVTDPHPVDVDALRARAATLTVSSWANAYRDVHATT